MSIAFSSLAMATPLRVTSSGSSPSTSVTRVCTLIAATSGSVPASNRIWMTPTPSLPVSLLMYFMPGTPLMARSSGTMAALVTVSELAPVYSTETLTSGGAMLGNKVIGRRPSAITPSKVRTIEMTADRTGRRMNRRSIAQRPRPESTRAVGAAFATSIGAPSFTFCTPSRMKRSVG